MEIKQASVPDLLVEHKKVRAEIAGKKSDQIASLKSSKINSDKGKDDYRGQGLLPEVKTHGICIDNT